jgi:hypothetical protein
MAPRGLNILLLSSLVATPSAENPSKDTTRARDLKVCVYMQISYTNLDHTGYCTHSGVSKR